ncbi:hypothetical protein OOZ54_12850 [Rhodopseudomonas palustris]|uniref:SAP domain-containing protein n=1 Tax=Rhodopseudomonas palustris TaxID=1076 RepID=UPI0022F14426|nr:hypothetical protein [Rhodopseudomonas palustris]WBU27583.1 hypothetical protein OOZ54_12850 [Rhodopseudomonas palustris]
MNEKVRIKFTETRVVDDHRKGTPEEQRFDAGKTYEMSARSADRWVKRGVAEWASDDDRATAAGASADVTLVISDLNRLQLGTATDLPSNEGQQVLGLDGGGDDRARKTDYNDMKVADLKALLEARGIPGGDVKTKADAVKLLERDDIVNEAIAAGDFDVLHVDELKSLAEKDGIDVSGLTTKSEIVDAIKARAKT